MIVDDEMELIAQAKKGDLKAFQQLVDKFRKLVVDRSTNMLGQKLAAEAEDVAQETFVRAWLNLQKFKGESVDDFRNWLIGIARNRCIDLGRKAQRQKEESYNESLDNRMIGTELERLFEAENLTDTHELVGQILDAMDYDCRILLIAQYGYGMKPQEAARKVTGEFTSDDQSRFFDPIRRWVGKFFEPLEREMKDRRDYCFKKLRREMSRHGASDSDIETKRDSRSSAKSKRTNRG